MESEHVSYLQVVTFILGTEEFAFDISSVKEVIRIPVITNVPKSQEYIKGVINLRGNVIPVIDLRKRFNIIGSSDLHSSRIIVCDIFSVMIGLVVDAVLETRQIDTSCVEPPPTVAIGGIENEYIAGVAKLEDRLLSLLHIDKILNLQEQESLKEP